MPEPDHVITPVTSKMHDVLRAEVDALKKRQSDLESELQAVSQKIQHFEAIYQKAKAAGVLRQR